MIDDSGRIQIFKWKVNVVDIIVIIFVFSVGWGITSQILSMKTKFGSQESESKIRDKIVSEYKAVQDKAIADLNIWIEGYKSGYKER